MHDYLTDCIQTKPIDRPELCPARVSGCRSMRDEAWSDSGEWEAWRQAALWENLLSQRISFGPCAYQVYESLIFTCQCTFDRIFLLRKLAHACQRVHVHNVIQLKCRSSVGQYVCVLKRDDGDVQVLIKAVRSLTDWSSVPSSFHPVIL